MNVIIEDDYEAMSVRAAEIITNMLQTIEKPVLGCATGSTPLKLYQNLIERYQNGVVDFSEVTTFNLDEYLGITPEDKQSYRYFMDVYLFDKVNIDRSNTHVPDGMTASIDTHCMAYEEAIKEAGGIDLQILGIGSNGHIGFNEPGSAFDSRTRKVSLSRESIAANARHFGEGEAVPDQAITMGIGTIMDASRILLLANGASKAEAIAATLEQPVTSQCPASVLQKHPDVIVILDKEAASGLQQANLMVNQ